MANRPRCFQCRADANVSTLGMERNQRLCVCVRERVREQERGREREGAVVGSTTLGCMVGSTTLGCSCLAARPTEPGQTAILLKARHTVVMLAARVAWSAIAHTDDASIHWNLWKNVTTPKNDPLVERCQVHFFGLLYLFGRAPVMRNSIRRERLSALDPTPTGSLCM